MSETRKIAAILAADVVGFSRMTSADEDGTLARLRALRSDLIDPTVAVHNGRVFKRTGDGALIEFRSVVDAVRCAIAVQNAMVERNAGVSEDRPIVFRIGIHLGDVVEESDGDLMGDGVNIAARLESVAAPGAICLSEQAYWQVKGRLDLAVTDLGLTQLKNIAEPVRAYSLQVGVHSQAKPAPLAKPATPAKLAVGEKRSTLVLFGAGIAASLIVIAVGAWYFLGAKGPAAIATIAKAPSHPSIAVMPFKDVGDDAVTGRLANGITTDIATDLSRLRDLDVIASSATAAYGKKDADVRQIAKDLNVRYVLTGSIQREGDQIRVNAQLLDGTTDASLWSRRWDRPAADVFAVQNEVADSVISTFDNTNLFGRLSATAARRKPPADLAAYDLYALAGVSFRKGTAEGFAEAIKYVDAAIAADPHFSGAYVTKGWSVRWLALGGKGDFQEAMREADRLARKAVELDPEDATAHVLLGTNLRQMGGDPAQASAEIERALELNPSSAFILNIAASSMSYMGRPDEGAALCDRAFRLNPLPDPWFAKNCPENYFFTKRYRESVDMVKRHAAWQPLVPFFLGWLAAAQIELGAVDDAAATVADWKRRFPDSTVEELLGSVWRFSRHQEEDQLLASLRKAGAPICVPDEKVGNFPMLKHLVFCDAQRAKEATP